MSNWSFRSLRIVLLGLFVVLLCQIPLSSWIMFVSFESSDTLGFGAIGFLKTYLKLVRTNIDVLLHRYWYNDLSPYATIISDECHAWFHLNSASQAGRNTEKLKITQHNLNHRTLTLHGIQLTSSPSGLHDQISIVENEKFKCPCNSS